MDARALVSASVLQDRPLFLCLVIVVAGAPIVSVATAVWLRRHLFDEELVGYRAALACTSLAALLGVALAVELVARAAWTRATGAEAPPFSEWATPGYATGWLLLGPCLFFWGLGERWLQTTPRGLTRVQWGHFVLWAAATFLALRLTSPF